VTPRQSVQRKKAFLDHFRFHGNIAKTCRAIGLNRSTVYEWQETDDQFVAAFREAEIEATETLEAEAHRRAVEGLRRLKFDKGQAVLDPATGDPYTEMEYSDTLLIFLLKARAPEKYRENNGQAGSGQPPVKTYPDGEWERLP
jgi:hypothetical protein